MYRVLIFIHRYLLGLIGCLYLATIGAFRKKHREVLHEVSFRLSLRRRPEPEPVHPTLLIPDIAMADVMDPECRIRILAPDTADGNVSVDELAIINALVAKHQPHAIFEIGTFDGRTTLNMAAHLPQGGTVYTLDLPPEKMGRTKLNVAVGDRKFIRKDGSGARFDGTRWADRIRQLYGDSAAFDYSPYTGKMDLVFVDGSHSYDYVKRDTETALNLIRPDAGIILWHDYGSRYWKGLTRALNELYVTVPEFKSMRHVKGTTLVVWERGRLCRPSLVPRS